MLPKFEPKTFIHALEKYEPSFLHLAPPLLAFCADHPGVRPAGCRRRRRARAADVRAACTAPVCVLLSRRGRLFDGAVARVRVSTRSRARERL